MTLEKENLQNLVNLGFTVADITLHTGCSTSKVRYWLKKFDLEASREKSSIGHKAWRAVLRREFPAYPFEEEYHIGEKLRLDFYIPALYTGFEVDGKQHREKVDFWEFSPHTGPTKTKLRERKEEICNEQKILLIRLEDHLAVKAAMEPDVCEWLIKDIRDRIAAHEPPDKGKAQHSPSKYSQYQENMLNLSREHRKRQYRRAKELKDRLKKESNEKKSTT